MFCLHVQRKLLKRPMALRTYARMNSRLQALQRSPRSLHLPFGGKLTRLIPFGIALGIFAIARLCV